jgi:hypothetical protein
LLLLATLVALAQQVLAQHDATIVGTIWLFLPLRWRSHAKVSSKDTPHVGGTVSSIKEHTERESSPAQGLSIGGRHTSSGKSSTWGWSRYCYAVNILSEATHTEETDFSNTLLHPDSGSDHTVFRFRMLRNWD